MNDELMAHIEDGRRRLRRAGGDPFALGTMAGEGMPIDSGYVIDAGSRDNGVGLLWQERGSLVLIRSCPSVREAVDEAVSRIRAWAPSPSPSPSDLERDRMGDVARRALARQAMRDAAEKGAQGRKAR